MKELGKDCFLCSQFVFPWGTEYKTAGREKTSVSGTDNIPTDLIYT